ncbi:helix-turn-helix domain-containing protein [Sulfitobacter sp. HNIBRBA3233]|uniref:helix-turn-helix domain-containing protein n=1 Tax=Sulfitobacter marinivivus TaxID=3158558 RepID=UPI0032DE9261
MQKLFGKVIETKTFSAEEREVSLGRKLQELRELAGMTQSELASRIGASRSAVSRIENRADVSVAALKKFVSGLGASLRIDASFDASSPVTLRIREAFEVEQTSDDQLLFPIFEEEPFRTGRDVVLSIKPQYSAPILDGTKTVELRRRFPVQVPKGTLVYIYSTSPIRALTGTARILGVEKIALAEMWDKYSSVACIERADFDAYFTGLGEGVVIKLGNVHQLARAIGLEELRDRFEFAPPQSFVYANPLLREALKHESSSLPH